MLRRTPRCCMNMVICDERNFMASGEAEGERQQSETLLKTHSLWEIARADARAARKRKKRVSPRGEVGAWRSGSGLI